MSGSQGKDYCGLIKLSYPPTPCRTISCNLTIPHSIRYMSLIHSQYRPAVSLISSFNKHANLEKAFSRFNQIRKTSRGCVAQYLARVAASLVNLMPLHGEWQWKHIGPHFSNTLAALTCSTLFQF